MGREDFTQRRKGSQSARSFAPLRLSWRLCVKSEIASCESRSDRADRVGRRAAAAADNTSARVHEAAQSGGHLARPERVGRFAVVKLGQSRARLGENGAIGEPGQ